MIQSLLDDFRVFKNIIDNKIINSKLDLSNNNLIAPTTLLPLLSYLQLNNIKTTSVNKNIKPYLGVFFNNKKSKFDSINLINISRCNYDCISRVSKRIGESLNNSFDSNSFHYLIFEMASNIYIHSKSKNAYILCQHYPKEEIVDLCFIDDGISIPGSFEKFNYKFKSDYMAIANALNGVSESYVQDEIKGYGLNTSARLVSEGFYEEMIIASREGLAYINKENKIYDMDKKYVQGTFISLRMNTKSIDFYSFMNTHEIKFKYYGEF